MVAMIAALLCASSVGAFVFPVGQPCVRHSGMRAVSISGTSRHSTTGLRMSSVALPPTPTPSARSESSRSPGVQVCLFMSRGLVVTCSCLSAKSRWSSAHFEVRSFFYVCVRVLRVICAPCCNCIPSSEEGSHDKNKCPVLVLVFTALCPYSTLRAPGDVPSGPTRACFFFPCVVVRARRR